MSQVTITDVQEVALLRTEDIRKWISLHKKSLESEEMRDYWDVIRDDLTALEIEYEIRNPIVAQLKEMNKTLSKILDALPHKSVETGPK